MWKDKDISTATKLDTTTNPGIIIVEGGNTLDPCPECSIKGVKPAIERIPADVLEQQKKIFARVKYQSYNGNDKLKSCCICQELPTVLVKYHFQDAIRVERYCDKCLTKQGLE